ncbi:LysR family transcriptional regulator [Sporosarcina sp. FSL K6-1522]|uniref:LysR family transcriptional regulator n=1 Tax=Sporosarcina sp. FSL K6-1522 TaxID=2921554 RepID=UPI00315AAD49
MELKKLNYFVTVVDQMSFSKAAEKLHISQPSLSKTIKTMEQELGFQIIERNTRNIRLTEAGEVLYKRANHLLLELAIVKQEMDEVKRSGKGEIRLGMIESVKHWLPKVIVQYKEEFSDMRIQLTEVLSGEDVKKSLRTYETHAIITNQLIKEDDITTIPLYNEKLVLVVHTSHPLAASEAISLKQLESDPFIMSAKGFQTREDILRAFESEGATPNIKFEIERFETVLSLVREGLGIAIIPESYMQGPQDGLVKSRAVVSPELERTVYLTYMKNRYISPAIRSFLMNITDYFE